MEPVLVRAGAARRFLVARHLLAPPRALPARPEEVLAVVRRFGSLQFDPLDAPGAKNHELVLHARIKGYEKGWCERFLYGEERALFEAYNKSLNILPIEELPYHRAAWVRGAERWGALLDAHRREVDEILTTLGEQGPLPTTYFSQRIGHVLEGGWGPTKAGRLLVEALFKTGRLGIARRDGNTRFYDLIERLFPADLLARRVSLEEALRHRLISRFRAHGLLAAGGQAEITVGTGSAAVRKRVIDELVAAGVLIPAMVESLRQTRYLLAEDRAALDAGPPPAKVSFLAPLDPFVWDRRLLRDLFGFDYTWEVYTPIAKRAHGYYVLPVLYRDRLIARIEPRFDRARRILTIRGFRAEPGFAIDRRFASAFDDALEAYRAFVGAERVAITARSLTRGLKRVAA